MNTKFNCTCPVCGQTVELRTRDVHGEIQYKLVCCISTDKSSNPMDVINQWNALAAVTVQGSRNVS